MKNIYSALIILVLILYSCQGEIKPKEEYLRWIGDIEHNDEIDKSEFRVCNGNDNILQYFNLGKGAVYSGEKSRIIDLFNSEYKPVNKKDQSGFIRIRFVVNCEGIAGRYRVLQSDENYQPQEFDEEITSQLLKITRKIERWEVLDRGGFPIDYYMYLIFKIDEGRIREILP